MEMDLEAEILREHSKRQTVRIAQWIGKDKKRYRRLMDLLLHGEPVVTQRAAWILISCFEIHPPLITPWIPELIRKMKDPDVHDALRRNVTGILQFCELPKSQLGIIATLCFEYLNTPGTPVAIQANAMTVLQRISDSEPDLKRELRTSIELMLPNGTGAICSRARRIMKQLDRELPRPRVETARIAGSRT
jgi:hypothetical protein